MNSNQNFKNKLAEIRLYVDKALIEIDTEINRFIKASKYLNRTVAKIHLHSMIELLELKVAFMIADVERSISDD